MICRGGGNVRFVSIRNELLAFVVFNEFHHQVDLALLRDHRTFAV